MPKDNLEENKQETLIELKALDEELKNLNSHLENMDAQIGELDESKNILNKFIELKKGDEIRVPISSGIYIKAAIQDTKNLMINVGSNISVEKTPEQVIKILDSQLEEMSGYRTQLIEQMKILINRIEEIQDSIKG